MRMNGDANVKFVDARQDIPKLCWVVEPPTEDEASLPFSQAEAVPAQPVRNSVLVAEHFRLAPAASIDAFLAKRLDPAKGNIILFGYETGSFAAEAALQTLQSVISRSSPDQSTVLLLDHLPADLAETLQASPSEEELVERYFDTGGSYISPYLPVIELARRNGVEIMTNPLSRADQRAVNEADPDQVLTALSGAKIVRDIYKTSTAPC